MELSNIPEIDAEHEYLHVAFKALIAKEGTQYDPAELQKEIDQLLAYLEVHFMTEENIMFNVDYFDYVGHQKTHTDLLYLIKQVYKTLPRNSEQIFHMLSLVYTWVSNHIDIESSLFRKLISTDLKFKSRRTVKY